MINNIIMHGRTAWVGELKTATLKNSTTQETFEKKTIDFRLAVPKSVAPVKTVKDGVEVNEIPTDFFYWQATGQVAEVLANYCSEKTIDGKLISREIIVQGHVEKFQQNKEISLTQKTRIAGKVYEVPVKTTIQIEVDKFVVERLDFCGPKPESTNKVVDATPVDDSDENIPEATVVAEDSTTEKATEAVVTGTDVNMDAPIQVPEGYNGEVAPF